MTQYILDNFRSENGLYQREEGNVSIFSMEDNRALLDLLILMAQMEGGVFEYCANNNKWLEINADPMRLDLPDYLVKEAIDKGIHITLGTDAHHIDHMNNMRFGVYVARRGWAKKADIVNTRSIEDFRKMLK